MSDSPVEELNFGICVRLNAILAFVFWIRSKRLFDIELQHNSKKMKIAMFSLLFLLLFSHGISWPIAFKKNSKSMPSIELRLAAPEDPLPQVSASVQLLERERMKVEEGLMSKLEDVFNKMVREISIPCHL